MITVKLCVTVELVFLVQQSNQDRKWWAHMFKGIVSEDGYLFEGLQQ
jgi:hypothetical protein